MNFGDLYYSLFSFTQKTDFGFRHLLDFVVIFVLIFLLLSLIKKTRATVVLVGIALLGVIYGASAALSLPIAQAILKSFFSVFLIILAVVFQKEFRRFFGFLGVIGTGGRIQLPTDDSLKTIIKSVEKMAADKIGALIIFPGKENIERHLDGGVRLNGHISQQLILSIFDSTSPGHDGAVVINKDLVRRFGVHLPLSENAEATKNLGTRHRAALGLAEASDALCVVVSEETGFISVAHNKKIFTVGGAQELEKSLRVFMGEIAPDLNLSAFRLWLAKNAKTLAYSFLLTIIVWLFFGYQLYAQGVAKF